jgi:hypothetical protein
VGYTISVTCESQSKKILMMTFLEKHYRSPREFIKDIDVDWLRGPLAEGLSYSNGRCEIGFDYCAFGISREFAFAICKWIALRVGRTTKLPIFGDHPIGTKEEAPYVLYDGSEKMPVRLHSQWYEFAPEECKNWDFCDKDGWWEGSYLLDFLEPRWKKKMRNELKRLSKEWEQEPNGA